MIWPTPPPPAATLTFHLERPGLPVPVYTFTVHPDGTGIYSATIAAPPPASRFATDAPTPLPTQAERPITLTPAMAAQLFEQVKSAGHFHKCESKAKNIADTGAKTFTYTGPDGEGSCTYNYTENKFIASLTETFYAIAFTLDEGRKLEQKHRFDRLGLDPEMRLLSDTAHAGHALELQNIAPILSAIVNDPQVLERVRNRAAALLATLPEAK